MKNLDLTTITVSGLAAILTKYETELIDANNKHEVACLNIENIFDEAKSRGIDLYTTYENERRI